MDPKKCSRLFINLKNRRCGRSMTLYIFQRQRSAMFHADHPTDIQSHASAPASSFIFRRASARPARERWDSRGRHPGQIT